MKNKHMVFIINNLGFGGAQKIQVFLANKSVKHYSKVSIVVFYDEEIKLEVNKNINIYNLGFKTRKEPLINKLYKNFRKIYKLRKVLKSIEPNLVILFSFEELLILNMTLLRKKFKVIASERSNPEDRNKVIQVLNRITFNKSDVLILQLEELKEFYGKHDRKKLKVIPNPTLLDNFPQPYFGEKKDIIVTATARFEYRKGIDILIDAFSIVNKKHPNYKLIIYGSGGLENTYRKSIIKYGLTHVVEIKKNRKNIINDIKCAKMFVLPSRSEGIPNILIEAMCAGIPTISADCPPGGPKFLTNDGERGLLFEVDDYEELAEKMILLIENKKLIDELSVKGLELIGELQEDKIYNMWYEIFEGLMNESNKNY